MKNMFFESLKEEYFKLVEVRKEALFIGDHDKIKNTENLNIEFIKKPFSIDEFTQKIDDWLIPETEAT